jgi:hypothetical protein
VNELLRREEPETAVVANPGTAQRVESVHDSIPNSTPNSVHNSSFDERGEGAVTHQSIREPGEFNRGGMHEVAVARDLGREYEVPVKETSGITASLLTGTELGDFRTKWDQVQTSFVDEPREAVSQADALVASVLQRIAEQSARERESLEKQWGKGVDVSTEDLRQALKRYRSFFDRLLKF